MSYEVDRERFQALMASEGMPREISKRILRWANTYQRLAVLACNGDRRPYVPCPASLPASHAADPIAPCLCDGKYWDAPGHEKIPPVAIEQARAERLIREWCERATTLRKYADPIDGARNVSTEEADAIRSEDPGLVYTARFEPVFSGDPRGACVKLRVPSGKTDDMGREGICVPTRRY